MKENTTELSDSSFFNDILKKEHYRLTAAVFRLDDSELGNQIRKIDFMKSLRNVQKQNVLNGEITLSNLLSTNLHVNSCSYTAEDASHILHNSTETQKEKVFPRKQLCEYMGITEEQYREIDTLGNRRDSFVILQTLFEKASKTKRRKRKVPHMLLIEELVSTLNAECIGEFLYDTAIIAMGRGAKKECVPWIKLGTYPEEKNISIECTDPNRVTVRMEFKLNPWWPKRYWGIKMRVEYDIAVVEDRLISYQDVYPTLSLLTAHQEGASWKRVQASYCSIMGIKLLEEAPDPCPEQYHEKYMCKGTMTDQTITLGMRGKTFTAQSMLAPVLQEAELPKKVHVERSFLDAIREFFARVARQLRALICRIGNLFHHQEDGDQDKQNEEKTSVSDPTSQADSHSTEHTQQTGPAPGHQEKSSLPLDQENGPEVTILDPTVQAASSNHAVNESGTLAR